MACHSYPPQLDFIFWKGKDRREKAYETYQKSHQHIHQELYPALHKENELFHNRFLKRPEDFSETLDALNRLKVPYKNFPIAVILQANHDHNQTFSRTHHFAGILTIAQTHHVTVEKISSTSQIQKVLHKVKHTIGKEIDLLVFMAHGCDTAMQFGEEEQAKAIYLETDINKEDFSMMNPSGRILLISCLTGHSFAWQMASITGLEVIAPMASIAKDVNYFVQHEKYGLIATCRQRSQTSIELEEIFGFFTPR